ncbi:hypothetical protein [Oribacterium sp. FC2011]|uniref:hypothetical protein n=1 Tax=Oribacterium sp. FC2011 TaxID=1408311 RepID=UPI000678ABDF|nr:hypothetical protein [Oribacterium sp. FC2011]
MKIKRLLIMMSAITSVMSITAFAKGWNWLDPNQDGVMECYYFNDDGTYLTNTTTPDGYLVDENGAWIKDGVVQTKGYDSGALNQAVTTQVLSINPGFKTNNSAKVVDNTFGDVTIAAIGANGNEIERYHGAALWQGLDNRDYTISEFKKILENSGATNISDEPEVMYDVSVEAFGGWQSGGDLSRYYRAVKDGYKGTILRNVITFTLGGYNFTYRGPAQAKHNVYGTVKVEGMEGEFSDFIYTINPYTVEWNVN